MPQETGEPRDEKANQNRKLTNSTNGKPPEHENAQKLLLTDLLEKKVQTQSGVKLGKLKDFIFVDDPKYAEVTGLVIGRPFGQPPLTVPWTNTISIDSKGIIVADPSAEGYQAKRVDDELLLRGKILDKKILDLEGSDVDVVYDIQLLHVEHKLFVVAADVSRNAMLHRLGFGRVAKHLVHGDSGEAVIPWKYVQPLETSLTDTKGDLKLTVSKRGVKDIHHEDLADILEELDREDRVHVFNALSSEVAANTLEATEPRIQREILADVLSNIRNEKLPTSAEGQPQALGEQAISGAERIAKVFSHMSAVQVADIVSVLPFEDSEELQKVLKPDVANRVRELVASHDVPASLLAVHRFLTFPETLSADESLKRYREEAKNSIVTMYVYVVNNEKRLVGVIDINELLQANPESKLRDVMIKSVITIPPGTMRGEIEMLFNRYHFRAIPVVDDAHKLVGVVREKDVFLRD